MRMITHDIPISPEQPIAIITTVQLGYGNTGYPVPALWDTGSAITSVDYRFLDEIKAPSLHKTCPFATLNGCVEHEMFKVHFWIDQKILRTDWPVASADIWPTQGIGMIIGMDLISQGKMIVERKDDYLSFKFVSYKD